MPTSAVPMPLTCTPSAAQFTRFTGFVREAHGG